MSTDKLEQKIWEIDNLPNRLTIFRIILIPFVLSALYAAKLMPEKQHLFGPLASLCFFFACITDFFDGYIARKRNIVTVFGSFLDPIADKFIVVSSLIMLLALNRVPDWVVIILTLRELYMTSLRLLATHQEITVPVSSMGKWKTTTSMLGIGGLMIGFTWQGIPFLLLGQIFIYIATVLSLISAVTYSLGLINRIKKERINKKRAKNERPADLD